MEKLKQYIWIDSTTKEILAQSDTVKEIFEIVESKPEVKGYVFQQIGRHMDI